MATKKSSKRSAAKKSAKSAAKKSTKSAAKKSSKATAKKSAKRADAKKTMKARPVGLDQFSKDNPGKCRDWRAWHDKMPFGTPTLHVRGKCTFPQKGFRVSLVKAVPQGINPAILLLWKIVKPPIGGPIFPLGPETISVSYKLKTNAKYTHVTILPDGVTVRVKIVV